MRARSVAISVEGYIGLPGAGKTYALAHRGLEAMHYGRRVFSNFGLEGSMPIRGWDCANVGNTKDPGPSCDCGHCFVSITRAVVLVDEINLWAPSRMWNALPIGLLHRWAQVRKYQTQILWSAQHESRVDKVIREVTGWMWECRELPLNRWLHWVPGWPTFALRAYEPSDLRHMNAKALSRQNLKLRPRVANAYDTFEIVDMGSHLSGPDRKAIRLPIGTSSDPVLGMALPPDPWDLASDQEKEGALADARYGAGRWGGESARPIPGGLVDNDEHHG